MAVAVTVFQGGRGLVYLGTPLCHYLKNKQVCNFISEVWQFTSRRVVCMNFHEFIKSLKEQSDMCK